MSRCGDVYENRVTREYCVILRGSDDRGDGPVVVHLLARPGAAVAAAHVHPNYDERFRVVSGHLTASIDGREQRLGPGEDALVPAGVVHDWWNASTTEDAHVLVEIQAIGDADPARFELMIGQVFGLANDGKSDAKGRPRPLHGVLIAQEFADVIRFAKPPQLVQRAAIALLGPIARRRGLRAIEPRYGEPHDHVEPDPAALAAAGLRDG
jgi:mannose-6-phosphate isomerase-like protein (cupin superfamily)